MLPLWAQQTPYLLSERLGETISPEEQAYFGLFPDVGNLVSASAFESSGSKIEIRIRTKNRPVVKSIDRSIVVELAKYLEGFERYVLEDDFQSLNWLLIRNLVTPIQPYKKGQPLRLVLHDGTSHQGHLLYAAPDYVLLTNAPDWFSYAAPEYITAIASRDIQRINPQSAQVAQARSLLATLFPPVPRAVSNPTDATSDVVYDEAVLDQLKADMALEPNRLPPEVREFVTRFEQEVASTTPRISQLLLPVSTGGRTASYGPSPDRFHFFLPWIPLSASPTSSTSVVFTGDTGTLEAPVDRDVSFQVPNLYIELEYALKDHLRLGINFQRQEDVPPFTFGENGTFAVAPTSEYLSGYSIGAFATFVVNPVHKNTRFTSVAPEFTLRLGLAYAQLETTSSIAIANSVRTFNDSHATAGALAQAGLDLYISQRVSLATAVQIRAYPNIKLQQQATSLYNQYDSYTYGYAEGRTYTAIQLNLLTGVRMHL